MIIKANRVTRTKQEIRKELETAVCHAVYAEGVEREVIRQHELELLDELCKEDV